MNAFFEDFKAAHARSIRNRGTVATCWVVFSALWRVPMFWLGLGLLQASNVLMRWAYMEPGHSDANVEARLDQLAGPVVCFNNCKWTETNTGSVCQSCGFKLPF